MNRILSTACLLLLTLSLTAQLEIKTLETTITDVTVFMSGAQVSEKGSVSLKAGENRLRIAGLPAQLDANSIRVEGNDAYTILGVRHQINYLNAVQQTSRMRALQDSLDEALFKQKEMIALKEVLVGEKQMLEYNRTIKGENTTLIVEDLKEMADFFRSRLTENAYKYLEIGEKERLNNQEIARLQNTLNSMNARANVNSSEIMLAVSANSAVNTTIRVSYFVQNAGWYPVYDLRAEDVNSPISFAYRAKVFQSTGIDWKNVNLTISTGNPTVGGQIPTLMPWYLYQQQSYNEVAVSSRRPMIANETPSDAFDDNSKKGISKSDFVQVEQNTVNTEFKISIPYTIPSDNAQYDVSMQTETLKADYVYITVPKLDNDAFLKARISDWAQYSLLPGESNIYFKGTFVGKGYIDPTQANDTLDLSLGRDRAINVKREMLRDYCKNNLLGNKKTSSKAYEITVQNNKKQSIELIIEDQLPISQNGEIEVEIEEISGAKCDCMDSSGKLDLTGKSGQGKLTWKVTLQPNETIKKQIRFKVTYPKKATIVGL
ncbi:MAG: DUF4139 domain-containing protein [Flavobacteriales bacterium]